MGKRAICFLKSGPMSIVLKTSVYAHNVFACYGSLINVMQHQEYHENDQSPKKEAEPKEPEEAQANEKPDEEDKEEELVDKDEAEPQKEEVELPPLISTDSTDDLLVCFCLCESYKCLRCWFDGIYNISVTFAGSKRNKSKSPGTRRKQCFGASNCSTRR